MIVIESHRDMDVWKKSMQLVNLVYAASSAFPKEELYGLTSQLRRAAVSIPCNIAEGRARSTRKDFAGFVAIAKGSLMETETLLLIAMQQKFLATADAQPLLGLARELERMLATLRTKLIASSAIAHDKTAGDGENSLHEA